MKSIFLLLAFVLATPLLWAQGIEFEHGTWQEVLAKAQKENKPIFVDVYTSWCGPCKRMAKEVFPQKSVGAIHNAAYINYKIDAEKGEGIEIAKKYEVVSYPTLMYLNPNGEVVFKQIGSMNEETTIATAQKVLEDRKKYKPLAVWEKEYESNKINPAFLLDYLTFRISLKLEISQLMDEYLTLTGEDTSMTKRNVNLIAENAHYLTLDSKAFAYLEKHKDRLPNEEMYTYAIRRVRANTRQMAYKNKDEKQLALALQGNTAKYISHPHDTEEEEWVKFYTYTKQADKMLSTLVPFMENKFLPAFQQLFDPSLSDETFSTQLPYSLFAQQNIIKEKAEILILHVLQFNDKELLKKGIEWQKTILKSKQTVALMSLLASLYYKTGDKKKALSTQEEALALPQEEKKKARLTEKYNHMKAGDIDDRMLSM